MIKNIIFDLAGVVLNLDLERDREALRYVGLPDFYDFPNHPEICLPCMGYLNGLISTSEFLDGIRSHCKEGITDADILWSMDAVLGDIPKERIEMIMELKKKYNVFLLSNLYEKAWAYTVKEIESKGHKPEDMFHKIFLSYEMQLAKPDARIYEAVFAEAGIKSEETAYFDDSKENIEAGRALGLHAHLVKINCLEECMKDALK